MDLLAVLGLVAAQAFAVVTVSGGYSAVVVGRLLITAAPLVAAQAPGHVGCSSCGS